MLYKPSEEVRLSSKFEFLHKYRIPSLFAVDTFFKYWAANYETANKKTNVRLKLKEMKCSLSVSCLKKVKYTKLTL